MTRFEEAKRLRNQGLTIKQIAKKMNIAENTAVFYVYTDYEKYKKWRHARSRRKHIPVSLIGKRIEHFGLPSYFKSECKRLIERLGKTMSFKGYKGTLIIDPVLLLLCRRYGIPTPKGLQHSYGSRGSSKSRYFKILNVLNGVDTSRLDHYISNFFVANPQYKQFLSKALNIASKIPVKLKPKNPRVLASVCIYISSIGTLHADMHRPLITQEELATYFKVTDVSIRNVYPELILELKDMNTILSKQEIEWLLEFRKYHVERLL